MFKSEWVGNKMSDPGVKPVKIVTHKRNRVYNRTDDRGYSLAPSHGWEIVTEISVLPEEVAAVKEKFGDGIFVDVKPNAGFSNLRM